MEVLTCPQMAEIRRTLHARGPGSCPQARQRPAGRRHHRWPGM